MLEQDVKADLPPKQALQKITKHNENALDDKQGCHTFISTNFTDGLSGFEGTSASVACSPRHHGSQKQPQKQDYNFLIQVMVVPELIRCVVIGARLK